MDIIAHHAVVPHDIIFDSKVYPSEYLGTGTAWSWYMARAFFAGPPWLYDRTDTIPHFLRIKNISPVPSVPDNWSKSLPEVMDARAAGLLASGKQLEVLWSCGIDSTAVLVALMRMGARPDQVVIHLTDRSIIECPEFYRVLPFRMVTHPAVAVPQLNLAGTSVLLTGELADQLQGSFQWRRFPDADVLGPYREVVPDETQEFFDPVVRQSHRPIVNLFDYFWMMNFFCNWQNVKTRLFRAFGANSMVHFYEDDDLQRWALTSPDTALLLADQRQSLLEKYKQPMRDYIATVYVDEEYRLKKVKTGSLMWLGPSRKTDWTFLFDGGGEVKL